MVCVCVCVCVGGGGEYTHTHTHTQRNRVVCARTHHVLKILPPHASLSMFGVCVVGCLFAVYNGRGSVKRQTHVAVCIARCIACLLRPCEGKMTRNGATFLDCF